MNNIVRVVGSAVIALILVSIPGLMVASFAFEWHGFLKVIFITATAIECVGVFGLIYERSEDETD